MESAFPSYSIFNSRTVAAVAGGSMRLPQHLETQPSHPGVNIPEKQDWLRKPPSPKLRHTRSLLVAQSLEHARNLRTRLRKNVGGADVHFLLATELATEPRLRKLMSKPPRMEIPPFQPHLAGFKYCASHQCIYLSQHVSGVHIGVENREISDSDALRFSGENRVEGGNIIQGSIGNINIGKPSDSRLTFRKILVKHLGKDIPSTLKDRVRDKNGGIVEEACSWILSHSRLQIWQKSLENQLLWLRGSPGKGKTSLAIYLAEHFEERWMRATENGRSHILVHYFFDSKSNAAHAFRSLLWSIFERSPTSYEKVILEEYGKKGEGLFQLEAISKLLQFLFHRVPCNGELRCVLDGLDDGSRSYESQQFLKKFLEILQPKNYPSLPDSINLKTIFVSRTNGPLGKLLMNIPAFDLDTEAQYHIDKSIETYIYSKLRKKQRDEFENDESRDRLLNILLKKSMGTFLWVGYMVKEVENFKASEGLDEISKTPEGLAKIYTRMLFTKAPGTKGFKSLDAVTLLISGFIATARRPLKIDELTELVVIAETPSDNLLPRACGPQSKIKKNALSKVETAISRCGQLFHVDKITSTVTIIHHSAETFLFSHIHRGSQMDKPLIDSGKANARMGQICVRLVMEWSKRATLTQKNDDGWNLLDYAIQYWPEHYRLCEVTDLDDFAREWINSPSQPFWVQRQSDERRKWFERYWQAAMPSKGLTCPQGFQMIHVAAFFGICWLGEELFSKGKGKLLRAKTTAGMTAMHWAVLKGHYEMAKSLLRPGINLEAEGYGMTPLVWAVHNQQYEIVELLLKNKARISARGFGRTTLNWAVWEQDERLVALLLQHTDKTDIEARTMRMEIAKWLPLDQQKSDSLIPVRLSKAFPRLDMLIRPHDPQLSENIRYKRNTPQSPTEREVVVDAMLRAQMHDEPEKVALNPSLLLPSPSSMSASSSDVGEEEMVPNIDEISPDWAALDTEETTEETKEKMRIEREVFVDTLSKEEQIIHEKETNDRGEKTVVIFAMAIVAVIFMVTILMLVSWKAIEPLFTVIQWEIKEWVEVIGSFSLSWSCVGILNLKGKTKWASKLGVLNSAAWTGFTAGWVALSASAAAIGEGPTIVELKTTSLNRVGRRASFSNVVQHAYLSIKIFKRGSEGRLKPPSFEDIVKKVWIVLLQSTSRWILELISWTVALLVGLWWAERGGSHSIVWALLVTSWVLVVVWEATVALATTTTAKDVSAWTLITAGSIGMALSGSGILAAALATLGRGKGWIWKISWVLVTLATSCSVSVCFVSMEPIPRLKNKLPLQAIVFTSCGVAAFFAVSAAILSEFISRSFDLAQKIWISSIPKIFGHTSLHLAAIKGNKVLVEMLLKAGADPLARDSDGQNAHYLASKSDSRDVAKCLQEAMEVAMSTIRTGDQTHRARYTI